MLVGKLVPAFLGGDPAYLPTFLGTYRAFGTPQQVLDLLFMRYGCILPYCDGDGGPLHQLKMAMASILGTWLHLYPEDFQQSPEFPCLKMLLAYVELNMPDSDLEQRARHLLAQLETLKSTEAEGNAPAGEEALETSPDLTPSPPLINPATAPESEQAQSPAPIQVQDLHQVSMPAPNPEPQHAHALALT
ncbi:ral guanine nucleotide dissociation stimulator-like [Ovis canadensis]|uniref:ral guanine nucleotide dissociation stimulator-like n=1 Tax=Ovis canadensis TaxID=37174 RepID=UPI0037528AF4